VNLTLQRFHDTGDSTLGLLSLNSEFFCFTLEDQHQAAKVPKETRIPAGTYDIKLRTEGGMHEKYKKYPFHQGMLWLQKVPGFEWVYIHVGNTDDHTEGCILTGYACDSAGRGTVQNSAAAYSDLYKAVIKALKGGEAVRIEVKDNG